MTSGSEGGMVVTNNEKYAIRTRKFAGIGYKGLTASTGRTSLASSVYQNPDYERFDTIGLNYRMNAITAAVGLAQLERIDHLVERRKVIGTMFLEAVKGCLWMKTQEVPDYSEHGYFTFGVRYLGIENRQLSWKDFYNKYTKMGGDGFYACWKNPYLEPSLRGKTMGGVKFEPGLCIIAEKQQKQLMVFKTNYRDLSKARRQCQLLSDLIDQVGR